MSKIDKQSVQKQLERILESADFQRSSRLSDFLTYIVQKTLNDEGDMITGYSIGVDVFGKADNFNSDLDSSVRVEAVRLRKALALYFHEDGKLDPVIINVPRGGYKPVFLKNIDYEEKTDKKTDPRHFLYPFFTAVFLITTVLALYFTSVFLNKPPYMLPKAPVVAVGTFNFVGNNLSKNDGIDFAYLISQKLSRFDSIRNIVLDNKLIAQNKVYDYLLEGTIRRASNEITVEAWLMDPEQETMVWRFSKKYPVSGDGVERWKDRNTTVIVSAIASMHGVIDNLELKKYSHNPSEHDEGRKCLLDFMAYDNNKTAEKHLKARTCLEKLVSHYPDYSLAWAYLSWLYGDEVRNNTNPTTNTESASERSLEAALKAVEKDQMNARAHMYLASAAQLNNEKDLMLRHAEISLTLNPYDTDILASAAWKYGRVDEWELNKKYAEDALRLNPSPPKWYHGVLFSYYFHAEMYDKALLHALSNYQKGDLYSGLCIMASYSATGQYKKARLMKDVLKKKLDAINNDVSGFLEPRKINEEWKQKFLEKLALVGLGDPNEQKDAK